MEALVLRALVGLSLTIAACLIGGRMAWDLLRALFEELHSLGKSRKK